VLKETGALAAEPDLDLKNTPSRMARMMIEELLSSYQPGAKDRLVKSFTTFPVQKTRYGSLVVVKDIPYASLCAHHGIPFFGRVHVGYIPNETLAGLSKLPRVVKFFSAKYQMQERFTDEIADFLVERLEPLGVLVVVTGVHLCMAMRGVSAVGAETKTVSVRGDGHEPLVKSEFYRLIGV
jgi:GTP cyclohydrolase IA